MQFLKMIGAFAMALFVAGCITSIYPIYTDKDLIFDASLMGTWVLIDPDTGKKEKDMLWTFAKSEEKAYDLTIIDKDYFDELGMIIDGMISAVTRQDMPDRSIHSDKERGKKKGSGEPVTFTAHLVKLGDDLFLDILPKEPKVRNTFYLMHMVPVHTFSKILIKGDVLEIKMLDIKWFGKVIEKKQINISHVRTDDRIIITASTQELQRFALKYVKNSEAFSTSLTFHRQKDNEGRKK
jgi:hypothetical protein